MSFDPYPRDGKGVRCPWQTIHRCPLYIESHMGRGLGCVDDMARPCKVKRGEAVYHHMVIELIRRGFTPEDAGHLEMMSVEGAA